MPFFKLTTRIIIPPFGARRRTATLPVLAVGRSPPAKRTPSITPTGPDKEYIAAHIPPIAEIAAHKAQAAAELDRQAACGQKTYLPNFYKPGFSGAARGRQDRISGVDYVRDERPVSATIAVNLRVFVIN